jgi:DNA-directed RNA polymerase III subunit RPC1
MTYPERVTNFNIEKLQQYVLNGPHTHPGANTIRSENGFARTLMFGDRNKASLSLKVGDIVERHMIDGDVVLFNRQPSLHKPSIMAHVAKICPYRKTFRFNECSCAPYNADFDGDEMNMHLPQTEEARAEAKGLMSISRNLLSPRNGEPLVAASQDFLTGAYLLTKKNVFFTRSEFCNLACYLSDASEHIDLPTPAVLKPRCLWTGKQLISLLVRPSAACTRMVNLECMEKFYTGEGHDCLADGYVLFRNGEHLLGNIGKKTLGSDSKNGLFFVLIRDFGSEQATCCMSRLAKLCARYLCNRGI